MPGADRYEQVRLLNRALKKRKYLMKIADVIGMAVGYRERTGRITDELALIVYVKPGRKEKDKDSYARHQRIPDRVWLDVGGKRVWLPVDLIESEVGKPQRDIPCGRSVGNVNLNQNTGSVGWVARRISNDEPVFCSNYHVLLPLPAHSTQTTLTFSGSPTQETISPSIFDGGKTNRDEIGEVILGRRDQTVDAAIIRPAAGVTPLPRVVGIGNYGAARFITPEDLVDGIEVQMRGRSTTEPARGRVVQYPGQFPFEYSDLTNPLLMLDLIVTDIVTQAGDSGSVLLDRDLRPLGILLGLGSDRSYFLHIRNVMSRMKVRDF